MSIATYLSNPVVQRGLAAAQALAGVPAAPSAPTQAETQRQQAEMARQRAFTAYLGMGPDNRLPAQLSTGNPVADEQERLRARYALMRDAGRSAVIERAIAQGRSVTYDQSGNPVIGDVNPAQAIGDVSRPSGLMQSQVVDLPQGGRAVYDREGRLVGTNLSGISDLDATDRAAFNRGQGTVAEQARLRSAMEEGVRKAMQTPVAAAAATAPVAATAAAPVAAAPVATVQVAPTPSAFSIPNVPTQPTPMAAAPFRDATGRVDTAAVARAQGRIPVETAAPPITPEQELEQAKQFMEQEPTRVAIEKAQAQGKTYQQQVSEITKALAQARTRRDLQAVRRLSAQLDSLVKNPPRSPEETKTLMEREPMWIGP